MILIEFALPKTVLVRLANSWWLTALLDFEEFQERRPSKGELRIVIHQFNAEFQAGTMK